MQRHLHPEAAGIASFRPALTAGKRKRRGLAMLSIQNSSYGVSALVSSQLPSATKNGDATPSQTKTSSVQADATEGTRAAGGPPSGPPPAGPPPAGASNGASRTAGAADNRSTSLTLLDPEEIDETDDADEATETTPEDLAAAHLMFEFDRPQGNGRRRQLRFNGQQLRLVRRCRHISTRMDQVKPTMILLTRAATRPFLFPEG